ncbi:MAG: AarF/ABC1/UbiB kinase family protein [Thermoanaerobaculia bacterium]|nr:AarF/ABC1/UbiB kinase family protein [Thermoanaerobaculia bacterium]
MSGERVGDFPLLVETPPPGLVGRYFGTQKHVLGLIGGGITAWVRSRTPPYPRGYGLARFAAFCARPFLDKNLLALPFPVQLRKRLEILGPTYIKLGQVLSLREDILPAQITDELKNLLDRLPAVPLDRLKEIIEKDLKRPVIAMFSWIDPNPLGSASIGQVHKAKLLDGRVVIVKVVKPGNRELLKRDTILLNLLGRFLQTFLERLQPRKVFKEFSEYTLRELDLTREADNAETFAANFRDMPDVVFPKIFREFSGRDVLCMEFLDGYKPTAAATQELDQEQRAHLLDLGAASIIRMLYRDGFFHADLHPGNLMILPGPKVGFIDLGMVGRFTEELKRSLMYYYYCLVMGDSENAARYLSMVAQPGRRGDVVGFRKEVEEICRRWAKTSNFKEYPLAHLILRSVAQGARYDMYFPVETVLMVKALVTFEGVGQILNPGFDVKEVSQKHVNAIFLEQFSPFRLAKEGMRGAPELIEALSKAPMLITEGLRLLESAQHKPHENPFAGLKTTLLAGACIIAAAILISFGRPWYYYAPLLTLGGLLAIWRRR